MLHYVSCLTAPKHALVLIIYFTWEIKILGFLCLFRTLATDPNSLIWDTGDIDVSRHFGVYVCGARVRLGLGWGSALLHSPHPQSLYPSLGVAANSCYTRGNVPHLPQESLTQLLRSQMARNPAWGRAQKSWGLFNAEHKGSICLDTLFSCNLHISWTLLKPWSWELYVSFPVSFVSLFFLFSFLVIFLMAQSWMGLESLLNC